MLVKLPYMVKSAWFGVLITTCGSPQTATTSAPIEKAPQALSTSAPVDKDTRVATLDKNGPTHMGPVMVPAPPKKLAPGPFEYDIAPGKSQDYEIGAMKAGTTLEFGNCNTPQRLDGLLVTVLDHGKVIMPDLKSNCAVNPGLGHSYATFSSRLGTESFSARITCPAVPGTVPCKGNGTLATHYDFNGDLTDVIAAYKAIPTRSMDASILFIDDPPVGNPPKGIFTDPHYGCSNHDDHPEGIVRLPNNRFAITTDFGNNGKLYLGAIGSKKVDDLHRLGTNVASGANYSQDHLIAVNGEIGQKRGHLGGATRSGDYLLTAAEADNDSVNGMISVIDTRDDMLRVVDGYTNVGVLSVPGHKNNDGAAWVTSAKLPTGSSDPKADNYIPEQLQNAHIVISAGTNMGTTNVAFRPRDTAGYSALAPNDRDPHDHRTTPIENAATPFVPWAIALPAIPGGDNQASLITEADGKVFLMTLNGDILRCSGGGTTATTCTEYGTKSYQDSNMGYSKLYRVRFSCPNGKKMCFDLVPDSRRIFETKSYVDFVRAAGSYIVATGDLKTETIMVYGLWATKVRDKNEGGCEIGGGGQFLRMMEF
jgi:hypothetical protein